jgi:filamentous hemagglutinin family protein
MMIYQQDSTKHERSLLRLMPKMMMAFGFLSISAFCHQSSLAQIIPDNTLGGENSLVNSTVTGVTQIDGGAIRGSNLFHSFTDFSILTGNQAFFNNPAAIETIITRVTGGNISKIDGLIRTNAIADLFFINPNGIIFGENAQLEIGGSFFASTAERILFADNRSFSATYPESTTLLSVNVPIGLQFGKTPGTIQVNGSGNRLSYGENFTTIRSDRPSGLEVNSTKTIGLLGGQIELIGGNLTTAGGRIELGSVGPNNSVSLTPVPDGWTVDYSQVETFQNIQLSQAASLDASGFQGGHIQVQGNSIFLNDGSVILVNILGDEPGGDLTVKAADLVLLSDLNQLDYPSSLLTEVNLGATGNGGPLNIETNRLIMQNGSVISSGTFGAGSGGDISIRARESVETQGLNRIDLPNFLLSQANENSTGDAGTITIATGRLILKDGTLVSSSTSSLGQGGNITILAREFVSISGEAEPIQLNSGLSSQAESGAQGDSGSLMITTPDLRVFDGGLINLSHDGLGNAGTVQINANQVLLDSQGRINASTALGLGGNVSLNVSDLLQLRAQSQITVEALGGEGNGGNLAMISDTIAVLEDSQITANALAGSGGNILITTEGLFATSNAITASSQLGVDGTVQINTPEVEPGASLVEFSDQVVDPTKLVSTGCEAYQGSQFTIGGRGTLPASPHDTLGDEITWVDFRSPGVIDHPVIPQNIEEPLRKSTDLTSEISIVEAQGWIVNDQGQIILTANPANMQPQVVNWNHANCVPVSHPAHLNR